MTLGCDTAAVLISALNLLRHQTSPAQHALLTPDERRSSLHQLTVAVEAAAKLAEVAHVEAVAVAGQHNAAGVDADRIRAEAERLKAEAAKIGKDVERVMAETDRTRVDVDKARNEKKRHTAAKAPPAAATLRSYAGRVKMRAWVGMPLPAPWITVTGLSANHGKVKEIEDALETWNTNNAEQHTLAGWGWFKHSSTDAFLFLEKPGTSESCVTNKIRNIDMTGTITLPRGLFQDLDMKRGYGDFIYGSGESERVRFVGYNYFVL